MSERLTLWQRWKLFLGVEYQCRCGALVPPSYRELHEDFHEALREWFLPPTAKEIDQARKQSTVVIGRNR